MWQVLLAMMWRYVGRCFMAVWVILLMAINQPTKTANRPCNKPMIVVPVGKVDNSPQNVPKRLTKYCPKQ
jgi:hypothetical protein